MNSDFEDDLINLISVYVQESDFQNMKMDLDIFLHDYEINKKSTEIQVYQGDVNEEILLKYLRAKYAQGLSQRTIGYYSDTLRFFFRTMIKPYNELTADDIRYYFAYRIAHDHITKVTANNERRNLSAFYGWLQKEEILLKNPMRKVDAIKVTKEKKKAFSLIEMEKIRVGCRNSRETATVEMLFSTWCRVSELVGIKTSDIHDGKCMVHGKGDKYREVYINAKAQLAVERYLADRKDSNPYLFPASRISVISEKSRANDLFRKYRGDWYKHEDCVSPTNPISISNIELMIRTIGKRVGVADVHPHRFRRTGATMALRQGMPIIQVSKLLGHENISTTQIYLDVSDEELEAAHYKYVI